ncbi:MAG TPA: Ig-like domain-containing protein, partial [Gemmatimonadales bacterium]|nr:Ig-like domain-containing protein [Gemmatimonadales bacterium]
MRRWAHLLAPAVLLGCSSLDEGEAGVVALEIRVPAPAVVEVGETIQFTAKPLDAEGDSVPVAVTWRSPDPTVTVGEATGLVTGVAPGTARVQAAAGSLSSELVVLNVIAPADTLILVGDSVVTAAPDPGTTAPLVVLLESRNPAGPLGSRPVIYEITRPPGEPAVVTLSGSVRIDTLTTAADGTAGVTVTRVAGPPV